MQQLIQQLFTWAFIGLIIYLLYQRSQDKKATTQALYEDYQDALKSGNKTRALQAGRAYYSHIRKGKLTIYDEQAIANDLSTMR